MTEKFKEAIDRGDKFGALLTDLSKACDCINSPLLIAKFESYEVSSMSTKLFSPIWVISNNALKLKQAI